jgi:ubiquitin-like protein Pup
MSALGSRASKPNAPAGRAIPAEVGRDRHAASPFGLEDLGLSGAYRAGLAHRHDHRGIDMVREQIERRRSHRHDDDDLVERHGSDRSSASGSTLAEEIDEVLDEIDAVLEENAEEFVKSFIQKGGE